MKAYKHFDFLKKFYSPNFDFFFLFVKYVSNFNLFVCGENGLKAVVGRR